MKTFLTTLLICTTLGIYGQTSCDKMRFMDQTAILNSDLPLQKLRKYESTNFITDSVKHKIKLESIKASSVAFFQELIVKKVLVFDSTVKKRINRYTPIFDQNGSEVDFLFVVFYEKKLNGTIPFIFRVDYKQNGELLNREQLKFISANGSKIITCGKAISTSLTDKVDPIKKVENIALYFNPTFKTVVYQISAPLNSQTQIQLIKIVNAYNGKIIAREKIDFRGTNDFEESKIGQ